MNRLQHESSPYLLQHAQNPVDWYPWGSEAFEKAQKEDKPIIVSIGYSTCHWCHVMERESFEDEQVARYMNKHFVNIKVDREERPDVDQIYMEACQVLSGSGGWPLNCFLLPDGRPFFAGTYYPPESFQNRPSWMQVMQNLIEYYTDKRDVVEDQANRLTSIIENSDTSILAVNNDSLSQNPDSLFTRSVLDSIFENLYKRIDPIYGGFGGAPKFPATMDHSFLLHYYYHSKNEKALNHVLLSLEKMIRGGIYDQIGGGFARYATDKGWLVPHFEKMLYDNALLVSLLADAYKLTNNELFKDTIEKTLTFIEREMTSAEGGFFAALDADSEGEEGKFYVWDPNETQAILGEDAELFNAFYDVTPEGNWEGKSILWRPHSLKQFAEQQQLSAGGLKIKLARLSAKLLKSRATRIRPGLDDKIILGWNALQCIAYIKAYQALHIEAYKDTAERNMQFLLRAFLADDERSLMHTYKNGKAQYLAFLDDYAILIDALIELYQITFNLDYLNKAKSFTELVIQNFLDSDSNLFYFTPAQQTDIIVRRKELYDSATPSGNSTMVKNLQRLSILFDRPDWRELAFNMLVGARDAILKYPTSFARWAEGLIPLVYPMPEIAVTGKTAEAVGQQVNALYIPAKVLMATEKERPDYALLAGKSTSEDINIYVCKDYACQHPVKSIPAMKELL